MLMVLRGSPSAWDLHRYGIILMKMGDEAQATENLTASLQMATQEQNEYLITENERLLEEIRRQ
ncbi:MAG: hypothetical protein AAF544_06995 [Bacteroidota bacterium]